MKLSRKQRFSKPPVSKRDPAQINRFQRKESPLRLKLEDFKFNQTKSFDRSTPQKAKKSKFQKTALAATQPELFNQIKPKNWWIHLWSGLVLDREARHKQAIRQAIWLYLYLLLVANRESGRLYRKISTIALETGFNLRSIHRWLQTLREKGYIETKSNGRSLNISITKWKPISRRAKAKPPVNNEQRQ